MLSTSTPGPRGISAFASSIVGGRRRSTSILPAASALDSDMPDNVHGPRRTLLARASANNNQTGTRERHRNEETHIHGVFNQHRVESAGPQDDRTHNHGGKNMMTQNKCFVILVVGVCHVYFFFRILVVTFYYTVTHRYTFQQRHLS